MTYTQTCTCCAHRWQIDVDSATASALSAPASWSPAGDELKRVGTVQCPQCGTAQPSGYRFFGLLTARGMTVLIAILLLGMVAAAWLLRPA